MNIINRRAVKADAKAKVLNESYGLLPLTGMYLLLTSWISTLVHYFVDSPMNSVLDAFGEQWQSIAEDAIAKGTASPDLTPAYAAAARAIRELLTVPTQQALLFGFLLLFLYGQVVGFGYRSVCLRVYRGEKLGWKSLFDSFWMAGAILSLLVATYALTLTGAFFMILPGLLFFYGLRAAPYILMEHPDWTVFHCMKESIRLTRGCKRQLILLDISFILWELACSLISNFAYDAGNILHPFAGLLLSLLLTSVVMAFYLPYKELSLIGYYQVMTEQPKTE